MARVQVGVTCPSGHFTAFTGVWEPFTDRDIDKLAERSAQPDRCGTCDAPIEALPHAEGHDRESPVLSRRGGRNIPAPLRSRPKARPKEGPLTPSEWKRRVFDRQRERPGGPALCAVTGEPLSFSTDDAHHPLEKSLLRARGLHHLVWDERNGVGVKSFIHSGHTSRMKPIPRWALPSSVWDFAREIGPWAVARVEQAHPATPRRRSTHV